MLTTDSPPARARSADVNSGSVRELVKDKGPPTAKPRWDNCSPAIETGPGGMDSSRPTMW